MPEFLAARPKKSMTSPTPYWPLATPSGTPKLRSVIAAQLPPMASICAQPFCQPSPCRMVSTVRCVVPERDGLEHGHVAEILRLRQVGPFARRGQLVRREVARVPHDPVAGQRLAVVHAFGIVDRIAADLGRHGRIGDIGLLQQLGRRQHLEGVRRRSPENLRPAAGRLFADEGDAGGGVLVEDFQLVVRVLGLERLLVRGGQFLRKRRDDGHRLGRASAARSRPRALRSSGDAGFA